MFDVTRKRRLILIGAVITTVVAVALPAGASASAALTHPPGTITYATVDYPGADWTEVNGVNRPGGLGQPVAIVGTYHDVLGEHGFIDVGGRFTSLTDPAPYAENTQALGINSAGQVVGTYYDGYWGGYCTFVYYGGTYIDPPLGSCHGPDGDWYTARGINNASDLAGNFHTWPMSPAAFLGNVNGGIIAYGYTVPSAKSCAINAINNSRQMVGTCGADGAAFTGTNLNGYAFGVPGTSNTVPRGINDKGVIVGYYGSVLSSHVPGAHGFVDYSGSYYNFDYPSAIATVLTGINDPPPSFTTSGAFQVVGNYEGSDKVEHGFIATIAPVIGSQP
jgi:hypothetical protein